MSDLNVKIALNIVAKLASVGTIGTSTFDTTVQKQLNFTTGTAADDQADILFADTRTLAASGTENLDLSGVLVGPLGGSAIAAAEIMAIYISAADANTNSVIVGNATSNAFQGPLSATGTLTLKPGDFHLLTCADGWGVTAATGDLLKVANSAGTTGVTYSIIIVGRTVAA